MAAPMIIAISRTNVILNLSRKLSSKKCPNLRSQVVSLDLYPRRHASTATVAAPVQLGAKQEQWQLLSAVCLERLPVVTQEMNALEQEFSRLMAIMETEYSCLSDHELRHRDDLKRAERKKEDAAEETETDVVTTTALEMEDVWEEELRAFTPASRTTEADAKNDVRSLERKLAQHLVLVVKQRLGSDPTPTNQRPGSDIKPTNQRWVLPMLRREEGESMREAAERTLATICGSQIQAVFLGNAPCSFYKYRYPSALQESSGFTGAKVFFFKAQHRGGQVAMNEKLASDFMWLGRDELKPHLVPAYREKVRQIITAL